jgi:hypothetical protein
MPCRLSCVGGLCWGMRLFECHPSLLNFIFIAFFFNLNEIRNADDILLLNIQTHKKENNNANVYCANKFTQAVIILKERKNRLKEEQKYLI